MTALTTEELIQEIEMTQLLMKQRDYNLKKIS